MSGWNALVQAEELSEALGRADLAIVDCRFALADPQAGERAYLQSHLPGAVYAHLDRDLSDHAKRGQGRHPWPDAADFVARLGAWGIDPQTQVVAYDDADGAYAARLWFLLRTLGHERVAVLDGGWTRWNSLGLPTETEIRIPVRARYEAEFDDGRLLDAARVQSHLDAGGMLVDVRAAERFRGETEPLDRVAGHVPGARNRPYALNLADGRFKPREQLAQEFRELLEGKDPRELVAMCGSGVTACHHLLAMAHAGLSGAKLFMGSWSGWISDPARPVATGSR